MTTDDLSDDNHRFSATAQTYLHTLCNEISNRSVGSRGNRAATNLVKGVFARLGWFTTSPTFPALDWEAGISTLHCVGQSYSVLPSPYSLGCQVLEPLVAASTVDELGSIDARGQVLLLHGAIASEQLMPKNFVFYNPEAHQRIVALLEASGAAALVCATGRNPLIAGGPYPFPLIEDGDFDIPSVYMTDVEGRRLIEHVGAPVELTSLARRIPSEACNVVASRGRNPQRRVVVTAHIDAKKGTKGAIDNATGIVVLLLLAEMLSSYEGETTVELVALNGEDHFAAPGQMSYLDQLGGNASRIHCSINIDGAGYHEGGSAFSFYGLTPRLRDRAATVLAAFPQLAEGAPWVQGDHSIFVQLGRPAIAFTSAWFSDNIATQDVTHTAKDCPEIVDVQRLAEIASAIRALIFAWENDGMNPS